MPSSSSAKKTEEKMLRTTWEESDDPSPVLCETDENRTVKEERSDGFLCGRKDDADKDPSSLRAQLEEMMESDPNGWQGVLSLLSPQAEKCLRETQDMNAKLRIRLTEQSNPSPPSNNEQGSDLNLIGARTTETGLSPEDDTPEQASEKMKFPRNKPCSVSEVSEPNTNPAVTNDQDCTPDVNSPLGKQFVFSHSIMPMACQKRLVSLVTEAATLLFDVTGGRRRHHHLDEWLSRVILRRPRARAVIPLVTLSR